MPIYEFECDSCKHKFEEWLKVSESDNEQVCPECRAKAKRVISNTSFILKGEGWYVTEYGNKKNIEDKKEVKAEVAAEVKTDSSQSALITNNSSNDTTSPKHSKDASSKETSNKNTTSAPASESTASSQNEQAKTKKENKAEKPKKAK